MALSSLILNFIPLSFAFLAINNNDKLNCIRLNTTDYSGDIRTSDRLALFDATLRCKSILYRYLIVALDP